MGCNIVSYDESYLEDLVAVFNRETADDPFVVPLTPALFTDQISSKLYFAAEGCFLAVENGRVTGFALTAPGIARGEATVRADVGSVDGLFFPRERLEIGDALLDQCLAYFEGQGTVKTVYGFASFGGYPYWRGIYCGPEPVCLSHYTHVWVTFMARGFTHHQQSLNYLGTPEPRTYRTDLVYEETDLDLSSEGWERETWKGHRPKMIRTMLGNEPVGRIGYVDLPYLSDYRGKPVGGIYTMGVEERFRRHGIATALIHYLFNLAYERGIEEILVGTTVENTAARRTYEKGGMRPVAFRTGTMYRFRDY